MNYQCQNPACDLTGEGVSEKIAKRRNHKCEACGSVLVPVVDSGASSAASRDSAELSALVADLPTMLALPLAEYLEETHPALKLWGLCDFTELSLRLLVIMGIADHQGHLPPSLVTAVKEVIDRPSLGNGLA